jgi:hypothetical protein
MREGYGVGGRMFMNYCTPESTLDYSQGVHKPCGRLWVAKNVNEFKLETHICSHNFHGWIIPVSHRPCLKEPCNSTPCSDITATANMIFYFLEDCPKEIVWMSILSDLWTLDIDTSAHMFLNLIRENNKKILLLLDYLGSLKRSNFDRSNMVWDKEFDLN